VPCLSKNDQRRVSVFQTAARIVKAIQDNFQAMRGILRNVLVDQPGRDAGTAEQLQMVLRRTVNTMEWMNRFLRGLELEGQVDPTAFRLYEEVEEVLRSNGMLPVLERVQQIGTTIPKETAEKPELQRWIVEHLDGIAGPAFHFFAQTAGAENAYGFQPRNLLHPLRGVLAFLEPHFGSDADTRFQGADLHQLRQFYRYLVEATAQEELIRVLQTARPTAGRGLEQTRSEAAPGSAVGRKLNEKEQAEKQKDFEEYGKRNKAFEESIAALDAITKLGFGLPDAFRTSRYAALRGFTWELSAPHAERQVDENRTIGMIVRDFYLDNIWKKRVGNDESARRSLNLVLMSQFYYLFGGFDVLGPIALNESKLSAFDKTRRALQTEKLQAYGETKRESLTVGGRYTIYKTYNPILFELTRMYWQTLDSKDSVLLRNRMMVDAIDTTGRYGYSLRQVQNAALIATSEEEVTDILRFRVHDAEQVSTADVLRGLLPRSGRRRSRMQQKAPPGTYEAFTLLWPLGSTRDEAQEWIDRWVESPLAVLADQKKNFQNYVQSVYRVRTEGTPKPEGRRFIRQQLQRYANDLQEGVRQPIDPTQDLGVEDRPVHEALRQSMGQHVRDVFNLTPEDRKKEAPLIRKFQSMPLNVRKKTERGVRLEPLEMPNAASEVYDIGVVSRLLQMEDSLNPPPDTKYRMTPLFGEEAKPELAILPRSVWSRMSETKKLHQERIAAIDSALKEINAQLAKK
jgi:hypothetical protein